MTKDKALKIALEALENAEYSDYGNKELNKAITALKEALAQPEQDREEMKIKSVTMRCKDYDVALPIIYNDFGRVLVGQPCIPPQRTWVGLTEEDLKLLSAEWRIVYGAWMDDFARNIEVKLKDKNT
jgi:hypothetical protein